MTQRMPTLFLSHGAPTLLFDNSPANHFLRQLATTLPRPQAIAVISAHWETRVPAVSMADPPRTIHDFGDFGAALNSFQYPAPGAPWFAERAAQLMQAAGLPAQISQQRGLDHGAWVPLALMWPDADIPVFQVATVTPAGPRGAWQIGQALAPLRDEGVLILGSGSTTHDLYSAFSGGLNPHAPEPDWVRDFAEWVNECIETGDHDALMAYRQHPAGPRNHPTEEHFLPLFSAMAAGGGVGKRLHASQAFGVIRMDCWQFA